MALHVDFTHPLRAFDASVELTVGAAETLAIVGPSGAGKTTVLRVAAGLLRPQEGRVTLGPTTWLDTREGVFVGPENRRVGFVFQEYALFPHLTVEQNVAFGAPARESVAAVLARLGIARLARARPRDLSGGERQRVALARALAREPDLLLLDEPLSALDAHTRGAVRGELRELLSTLDLPTLLVTHDFEDAATLADRVGVISDGRILQVGATSELLARPSSSFVASFVGANLLHGYAAPRGDGLTEVSLDAGGTACTVDAGAGRVAIAVFPWEVSVAREAVDDSSLNHVRAPVSAMTVLGNRVRVTVGGLTAEVTAASAARLGLQEGEVVTASFKATATRLVAAA